MKICTKCNLEFPETEFYKNKSKKLGINNWCKLCSDKYVKEYSKSNPEKMKVIKARWVSQNKDLSKELTRKWRQKAKAEIAIVAKTWRENNQEKCLEYKRRWNAENKDKINARRRQLHEINPSANASYVHKRRARKKNSSGSFSAQDFTALKQKYDNRCLCCEKSEPEIKLTPDHILPLCKGGDNTIENIQPLCQSCNSKKHTKYIDYRPFIIELSQQKE